MKIWTAKPAVRSLLLMLVCIAGMILPAQNASAQQVHVTGSNLTVGSLLEQITAQTGMPVSLTAADLDLSAAVSPDTGRITVPELLDALLRGTGNSYVIQDSHILIYRDGGPGGSTATVRGSVTDTSGKPLIGATVIVNGAITGAVTGTDGTFSVQAPSDGQLLVSYIGYLPEIVNISGREFVPIVIREQAVKMDEVVVVAYGTQKRVNLSGAVSSVNLEDITENRAVTSLRQGLQGQLPGLMIEQTSGLPGAEASNTLVRGASTWNNNAPLVVIDGIVGDLNEVAAADVASVTVLKDAASSSIYGSRAANGVILITTKRGSVDKTKISYNAHFGFQKPTINIDILDDFAQYMEVINSASVHGGQPAPYMQETIDEWREFSGRPGYEYYANTNWFKDVYQPGFFQQHTLQASGASKKIDYMFSFDYQDNNGSMPKTGYERYSIRSNLGAQIKPFIKLGVDIFGYRSIAENNTSGTISDYMGYISNSSPGILPRSADGKLGGEWAYGMPAANNVFGNFEEMDRHTWTTRVNFKPTLTINITPKITWHGSMGVMYQNLYRKTLQKPVELWNLKDDYVIRYSGVNRLTLNDFNERRQKTILDTYVTWSDTFAGSHSVSVIAGYNQEYEKMTNNDDTAYELLTSETDVMDTATDWAQPKGGYEDRALMSYFGRINYSFRDRYLFEANIRGDGSSKFAPGHRWGWFPSFSAAWRISEEGFMKGLPWLNNLKIRASWGTLGNNRIADYPWQEIYKASNAVIDGSITGGMASSNVVNLILTWEEAQMTNAGLDIDLFGNRLLLVLDAFYKMTKNILVDYPLPLTAGGRTAPKINDGIVSNRGFEVSVNWNDRVGPAFSYGFNGNYSFSRSRVERFNRGIPTYPGGNKIRIEGVGLDQFYVREFDRIATQEYLDYLLGLGYDFLSLQPKPGDLVYKDQQVQGQNGYLTIDDNDRVIKGNSVPEHLFGFTLYGEWKGLDFSMFFQGVAGVHRYLNNTWYTNVLKNGSQINKRFLGGWTEENPDSNIPALTTVDTGVNTVASDYWLQNASYLRMKNIQVGYTIPRSVTSKFLVERLRIYVSAENLFTVTGFKGLDPELSGTGSYPNLKKFVGGISVTF